MFRFWNRVGRVTRLTGLRLRAALVMAMVLVFACTGGGQGGPSSDASGPASPTADASPRTASQRGWLAVDLRFYPDVFFSEGSILFIEVSDASGELVRHERSRDWRSQFRMQLAPGAYAVRTYRRPCDGSCRALDPAQDPCGYSVEMAADGSDRLVIVRVARDGECRVSDRGDVLEVDLDHAVADLASFTRALVEAGHEVHVRPGDRWLQRFFLVPDRVVKIDDRELHVFEYASVATRNQISISSDGTGITSKRGVGAIIEWTEPHFFRSGRLIVLFLGDDPVGLETMSLLLGPSSRAGSRGLSSAQ